MYKRSDISVFISVERILLKWSNFSGSICGRGSRKWL